jgi:hypothetical protein
MSSGVSQIGYWRETNKAQQGPNAANIDEGGEGATYLSYNVFLGLSVIGGLLALDHLYLRSPLTFLAKIVINILFFGAWWLYDASQAIFNRDVVKVFGLGVPGMGPKGIAAGVLASDVPDKKHMSFFIYALALLFGGLFGLDSFIVGDTLEFGILNGSGNNITFGLGNNSGTYTGYCGLISYYTYTIPSTNFALYINIQDTGSGYVIC